MTILVFAVVMDRAQVLDIVPVPQGTMDPNANNLFAIIILLVMLQLAVDMVLALVLIIAHVSQIMLVLIAVSQCAMVLMGTNHQCVLVRAHVQVQIHVHVLPIHLEIPVN